MNEFEEYIRLHHNSLINALVAQRRAAIDRNDDETDADTTYWQHEINALVDVVRKLPK